MSKILNLKNCVTLSGCFVILCSSAGCTVPPLDNDVRVSVADVVVRVKCQIADAARPYYATYSWFRKWTVEVDLNLVVTDAAGVTPSLSLIHQLPNAVLPQISPITQNFTLLVSGNMGATSTRNETVSFGLSVKDLTAAPICGDLKNTVGLDSDLGIKAWIDEVFEPIRLQQLTEGVHPLPQAPKGIGAIGTAKALGGAKPGEAAPDTSEVAYENVKKKYPALKDYKMKNFLYEDIDLLNKQINAIKDVVDDPANKLTIDLKKTPCLLCYTNTALDYLDLVLKTYDGLPKATRDDLEDDDAVHDYIKFLKETVSPKLNELKSNLTKALGAVKLNPPIEAISHQVAFTVALSGGIGPSWTLASFKGPAPAVGSLPTQTGSLLSASRARANNLTITLGSPSSSAAAGTRNAAFIANSLRNAFGP